jgi:Recombination endonuclease VII
MAVRRYSTDAERLAARRANQREAARRWREKNPEAANEAARRYREEHRDTAEYKEKANLRSKRWREENRERHIQKVRQWCLENPEQARELRRKSQATYRIRYPERIKAAKKAVVERFAGRPRPASCEVCGREPGQRELCADHCHSRGHFRGWLCLRYNCALGLVADDPNILRKLIAYLECA